MSTAPSKRDIPQTVDPRKLANQGVALSGFFKSEQLPRVENSVLEISAPVATELNFFIDESGVKTLAGSATAQVMVQCQRCLQPMQHQLHADIALAIVWDEEAARQVSSGLDPWIVGGEAANLCELIEEELLLELPYVNYHEQSDCKGESVFSTDEVGEEQQRPNPFQVLQQLKSGKAQTDKE